MDSKSSAYRHVNVGINHFLMAAVDYQPVTGELQKEP